MTRAGKAIAIYEDSKSFVAEIGSSSVLAPGQTQGEDNENSLLQAEREKLQAENKRLKEALSNPSCPTCGGPVILNKDTFEELRLRIENARLREETEKMSAILRNSHLCLGIFERSSRVD